MRTPGQGGSHHGKWGGFIEGVDEFDPLFFNISPREAELSDPQERLFLQCAYSAIEDAGYTRTSLGEAGRSVGVFVGAMYEEYQLYGAQAQARGQDVAMDGLIAPSPNRVSYWCDFQGPSLSVDTMCSSSLVALHLACQSLSQRAECEAAIAGWCERDGAPEQVPDAVARTVHLQLGPVHQLRCGRGRLCAQRRGGGGRAQAAGARTSRR